MVLIHEKISALLEQTRLKKRDLARALGVSPQTATDICKGRSAITLPHLRNLVAFFELRADFWLDDSRLLPSEADRSMNAKASGTPLAGSVPVDYADRLLQRLRSFVRQHRAEFLAAHPDLSVEEQRWLGLLEDGSPQGYGAGNQGTVGRIAET
ncbi:MAG: helix-turn-helix domain-containing protein [Planctomycetes bacterium]|nr:helix-turn-helix domain-containing protein [Planctomycetota bacterium]MCB9886489.1 helix-turn-helix domain-containing protein [Planctomycetota bacterium]